MNEFVAFATTDLGQFVLVMVVLTVFGALLAFGER